MEPDKLKQIVEAALLAADEPLKIEQLAKLFRKDEIEKDTLRAGLRDALTALTEEAEGRGYELMSVASGYRYQVRQELSGWISRLWEEKPPRYTRALLETLSLVAYKQPVTRGDIEQVRGVSVSQNIMRTLLERGWIRVVGQREVPGRPSMYGTTREFLDYFNLKSLDQLPPLAEIRELIEPVIVEELEIDTAAPEVREATPGPADVTVAEGESAEAAESEAETPTTGQNSEEDSLAAEVAASLADEDHVDLDSEAFEAEIAAALQAADAASARFNNPEPGTAEDSEEETGQAGTDQQASDNPDRAQVVDVVTNLDTESAGDPPESEEAQPTAEVVQLPRAPH